MKLKNRLLSVISGILILAVLSAAGCGAPEASEESKTKGQEILHELKHGVEGEIGDMLVGEDTVGAEAVSEDKFAYKQLNDVQKQVYNDLLYVVENHLDKGRIESKDSADIERAYIALQCDYPYLFWYDSVGYTTFTVGDTITGIDVEPNYTMDEETAAEYQAQIDAEVEDILSGIPEDATDYDKALHIYNELIDRIDYDYSVDNNQNLISAFIYHKTVCQGYAYATQYLLEKVGIPCATVSGTGLGEPHAWNLAQLDGEYYYIDTTWGDPTFEESVEGEETLPYTDYSFFCMTTEEMSKEHIISDNFTYPECTATADSYFVHEGLYFEEMDADAIGNEIAEAYNSGKEDISLKFGSTDVYDMTYQYFVEDFHIRDYIDVNEINYMDGSDKNILMLVF